MNKKKIPLLALILRWSARIFGLISAVTMLILLTGEGEDLLHKTLMEFIALLFFPLGMTAGLILAWWKEGLGGLITLGSLILFYLVYTIQHGSLPNGTFFLVLASPAILFLISWLYRNVRKKSEEPSKPD